MAVGQGEVDDVDSFEVAFRTGVTSRGLSLCIVQTRPRALTQIIADESSPANLDLLTSLLKLREDGGTIASDYAQERQTTFVVCPEYALASSDWSAVMALVTQFPRQLILVAGFGAATATSIAAIEEHAAVSGLQFRKGWDTIPVGHCVNFGAAFFKNQSGDCHCILFGKNFPEQRHELTNLRIAQFPRSVEIKLEDLRVLPFICADLLESQVPGGDPTIAERMGRQANLLPQLPTICVGSLMQTAGQASEKWQRAISTLLGSLQNGSSALVIANVATQKPDNRTGWEKWKNLSGFYVARNAKQYGQLAQQVESSYFEDAVLMAWPVRSFGAQAVIGTASLPPYQVNVQSLHPWKATVRLQSDDTGSLSAYSSSPSNDELLLLASGIPGYNGGAPCDYVIKQLEDSASLRLTAQFLNGPFALPVTPRFVPDLKEVIPVALRECLAASDALLRAGSVNVPPEVEWLSDGQTGQLRIKCGGRWRPTALWVSPEIPQGDLLAKLRDEVVGKGIGLESLTIFGKGSDGDFNEQEWADICEMSTTASDQSEYSDLPISEAMPVNIAAYPKAFQLVKKLVLKTGTAECGSAFSAVTKRCSGENA